MFLVRSKCCLEFYRMAIEQVKKDVMRFPSEGLVIGTIIGARCAFSKVDGFKVGKIYELHDPEIVPWSFRASM